MRGCSMLATKKNTGGLEITLRRRHTVENRAGCAGLHTPAAFEERQRAARQKAAEESIRQDPLVKSIVERFEGRVVEEVSAPQKQPGDKQMMNNMGDLMKKAQQMQEQMQKAQEEIAKAEVTGESGAGW